MKKLRIGIIGCGGIANNKHFPSLKEVSDQCEMVAFCDTVEERAIKGAKEFGSKDAKVYTDYKELLKDASIDVVHVLTPNVFTARLLLLHLKLVSMCFVKSQWPIARKMHKND